MTDQEKKTAHALAKMVEQYMGQPDGSIRHEYLAAQEEALDVLEDLGWIREQGGGIYLWQIRVGFDWEDTFDMIEKAK